jgi:hypothetical protein
MASKPESTPLRIVGCPGRGLPAEIAEQFSGLAFSRLPGFPGTVGSPAAAGGAAATRLPAAARAGSAAAGMPRPPGAAHSEVTAQARGGWPG